MRQQYTGLPRKEYKTITVKLKTFLRFVKIAKAQHAKNSKSTNSTFLDCLLDLQSV